MAGLFAGDVAVGGAWCGGRSGGCYDMPIRRIFAGLPNSICARLQRWRPCRVRFSAALCGAGTVLRGP
eukprot:1453054-Alexandrium_andersonii.AAC.1